MSTGLENMIRALRMAGPGATTEAAAIPLVNLAAQIRSRKCRRCTAVPFDIWRKPATMGPFDETGLRQPRQIRPTHENSRAAMMNQTAYTIVPE